MTIATILFFILLVPYMITMSLFSLTIGRLLPMQSRMKVAITTERVISFLLRICCSIRVHVEGKEHLQQLTELNRQGKGLVIFANHQSPWETFYLQSIFFPLKTVLKQELLNIPLFGWSLRLLDPVILNRSNIIASASQIMTQGKERLMQGNNLLIFPQGTRMPLGRMGRFSRAPAEVALLSDSHVIPVAHNAGAHWPNKRPWMKSGTIYLVIGEPLDCTGMSSKAITAQCSQWIEQQMQRISQQ